MHDVQAAVLKYHRKLNSRPRHQNASKDLVSVFNSLDVHKALLPRIRSVCSLSVMYFRVAISEVKSLFKTKSGVDCLGPSESFAADAANGQTAAESKGVTETGHCCGLRADVA